MAWSAARRLVNCCGRQGDYDFVGGSAVCDPLGGTIASFGEREGPRVVDFNLHRIDRLRTDPDGQTYPLHADRVLTEAPPYLPHA